MESREAYEEKIRAKLGELDEKLNLLRLRADMAKTEVKLEYTKMIIDLRSKKEEAQKRLEKLKDAGGDAWKTMAEGMEKAVDDLKGSFDKAISKLK